MPPTKLEKLCSFVWWMCPNTPNIPMACILDRKPLAPSLVMPLALANPVVSPIPSDEYYCEEGCLSFPGIRGEVARPDRISVKYQDLEGNAHELECDGLACPLYQHEVDHLHGILFIDRMEKNTYAEIKAEVKGLKKRTQECLKAGNLPEIPAQAGVKRNTRQGEVIAKAIRSAGVP